MKMLCRGWKGIQSIGPAITATINSEGGETNEVRPFISCREAKEKEFSQAVRGHGAIESMCWILNVVFDEDKSRLRNGESTQNFGFLRQFVITRLKLDTSKGSLRGKRKRAA